MASKGFCDIKIKTGKELHTTPRILRIWDVPIMLNMPCMFYI
jgi:hypothetical protein